MLTGQEKFETLIRKFPQTKELLKKLGITAYFVKHNNCKNIAEASLKRNIPVAHILSEISKVSGEPIKKLNIKGLDKTVELQRHHGTPEGIKKVFAFHSGKGGVGKTFVSVNTALEFAKKGYSVGLLDADIDCPNVAKMVNLEGHFSANEEKKIIPLEKSGVKIVSIAPMLKNKEETLLWRGPIIARAIEQLIYDVAWGNLDFLIIDMPPGTSDVPISLLQMLNNLEVIIVTTPQELALLDAKKSASMAKKLHVPIRGVIENMSGAVFGKGGGKKLATEMGVEFLESIPLMKKAEKLKKTAKYFENIIQKLAKN